MTTLKEPWLQDIAESIRIPAVSPMVTRTLLPVIELQIRKIAQQAFKFYKRGKGQKLTGKNKIFLIYIFSIKKELYIILFLYLYIYINTFSYIYLFVIVEDINLALSMNRVEEIYGLHTSESQVYHYLYINIYIYVILTSLSLIYINIYHFIQVPSSSSSSSLSSTSHLVDPITGMISIGIQF
jgi:hypothetical protein